MTKLYLIALLNLALCGTCLLILLCRINGMGKNVRKIVALTHCIGVGAMMLSAFRPLIGEWPGYASLGVAVYVLYELLSSAPAWKGDNPPDVATDHAPLEGK